ncbi:MAG: DMT family transporter [Candidatus Cloacimonadota bacterium]|nr:MAG: DMT family transporter [Candidatus Cloacimonadota bacterium]
MKKQKQAYLYAVIAVLFWSTVASVFKITLGYMDVFELLFFSSLTSVVFLFLLLLVQKKMKLLRTFCAKDFFHSAALGFLNPFLYYIVLFKAYDLLRAQEALALNYTWPVVLALLSIPLLKQKMKLRSIIAIAISFIGAFVIAMRGNILSFHFTNATGVLIALGSTVIWSLFWIYNVKDRRDETVKLFLNFCFGFIFIFITMLLTKRIRIPDLRGFVGAGYVGLFEMGITFILWLKALQLSKTTAKVGNLIYLSPFISLIIISRVVGEKILLSTIGGLVLIIAGIILQTKNGKGTDKKVTP